MLITLEDTLQAQVKSTFESAFSLISSARSGNNAARESLTNMRVAHIFRVAFSFVCSTMASRFGPRASSLRPQASGLGPQNLCLAPQSVRLSVRSSDRPCDRPSVSPIVGPSVFPTKANLFSKIVYTSRPKFTKFQKWFILLDQS